jgi:multisubunit Na+/H+ antiporter MnhC subunit
MELLTAIAIGTMFAVGVFQLLRRNVIRSAIGLLILANAVNLFLLSTGASVGMEPPYVSDISGTHTYSNCHQHGWYCIRFVHALHYLSSLQDQ